MGGSAGHRKRKNPAIVNEQEFPYVVEVPLPAMGFDVRLCREMEQFHRVHDMRPRFGSSRLRNGKHYARWCFPDPETAHAFNVRFGGALITIMRAKAKT